MLSGTTGNHRGCDKQREHVTQSATRIGPRWRITLPHIDWMLARLSAVHPDIHERRTLKGACQMTAFP